VKAKLSGQPPPAILVRLNQLDQRLQQHSARILQRLHRLNHIAASTTGDSSALASLRNDLTGQEPISTQRIQTARRLERGAATPSVPGGV
jgi:hypothetical protein